MFSCILWTPIRIGLPWLSQGSGHTYVLFIVHSSVFLRVELSLCSELRGSSWLELFKKVELWICCRELLDHSSLDTSSVDGQGERFSQNLVRLSFRSEPDIEQQLALIFLFRFLN